MRGTYCTPTITPSDCFAITIVFSHAQSVVVCNSCNTVLCQPTGGRARLTEGIVLWRLSEPRDVLHAVSLLFT